MSGVVVRRGTAAEAALVRAIIQAAFSAAGPVDPPLGALRESAETLAAKIAQGETLLIAERRSRAVGCLFARPEGRALYVGRLAVSPEAQGQGVGRALLSAAEDLARAAASSVVQLKARVGMPENLALFARMGFEDVGAGRHDGYDAPTYRLLERAIV